MSEKLGYPSFCFKKKILLRFTSISMNASKTLTPLL